MLKEFYKMVYRRNLPLEFVIREFPIKILPEFLGFIFKFFGEYVCRISAT